MDLKTMVFALVKSVIAGAATAFFIVLSGAPSFAAGHVALLSPVPLQTLKTDTEAQKLTASVKDAVNRVPGVDAVVISNDPNKASAAAFVLEGSGLTTTGLVSSSPPPTTDYSNVAANPAGATAADSVTVNGKNIKITAVGVTAAKAETNVVADFLVQPTLIIDPSNSSNLTLYLFVTRHDGGMTKHCHWAVSTGAAGLNKMLAKVSLMDLFEQTIPADLGTVLVVPQRLVDLTFASRVHDRLGDAHLATIARNDISLENTRAELSIACATAGARTILAWGVETDKEPRIFGGSGYHAHVSFDLLNCLPTDYNPGSVSSGLIQTHTTNLPGVIASIGAILQTATRMTIAPIANVLSGSTILAILPQADDKQNTQRAVDAAIHVNVDKLCTFLSQAQHPGSVIEPGCSKYHPAPPASTALVTPTPTYPPAASSPSPSPAPTPAYFIVKDGARTGAAIRIRLEDPALIAQANLMVKNSSAKQRHIQGKIVLGAVSYEQGWGFYVDPASITFFDVSANMVCNKGLDAIAHHKQLIGGDFLPGAVWCPWNSYLVSDSHPDSRTGDTFRRR